MDDVEGDEEEVDEQGDLTRDCELEMLLLLVVLLLLLALELLLLIFLCFVVISLILHAEESATDVGCFRKFS